MVALSTRKLSYPCVGFIWSWRLSSQFHSLLLYLIPISLPYTWPRNVPPSPNPFPNLVNLFPRPFNNPPNSLVSAIRRSPNPWILLILHLKLILQHILHSNQSTHPSPQLDKHHPWSQFLEHLHNGLEGEMRVDRQRGGIDVLTEIEGGDRFEEVRWVGGVRS